MTKTREKIPKLKQRALHWAPSKKYHLKPQPIHPNLTPDPQPQSLPDDLVHDPRITKSEKPKTAAESSQVPSPVLLEGRAFLALGLIQMHFLLRITIDANRVDNAAWPDMEAEIQPTNIASTLGKRKRSFSEARRQKWPGAIYRCRNSITMTCYQYFYGWDLVASHCLPSFTAKIPPLITVSLAFANIMATWHPRGSANRCFIIGSTRSY